MNEWKFLPVLIAGVLWLPMLAGAHEFLVKPETLVVKKGEQVPVALMASHVFMVSEEMEPLQDVSLNLKQGSTTTPLNLRENAGKVQLESVFTLPSDGPAQLIGHRAGQVWCLTTRGIQSGTRQVLEAKGMTVKSCTVYEKFSKTLINAKAGDKSFSESAGQKLEIIPLINPAGIKTGDEMQFKVLYDGKPLPTAMWATYDGFSKRPNTYAYYTEADEQGVIHVRITAPGTWMVRAAHTVRRDEKERDRASADHGGMPAVDAQEMRTVLVFRAG